MTEPLSDPPSSPPSSAGTSAPLLTLGILFMLGWFGLAALWAMMSFMGAVMATDSGSSTSDQYSLFFAAVAGGQLIATAAGVSGGLAFFKPGKRGSLISLFFILLIVGVVIQFAAFQLLLGSKS